MVRSDSIGVFLSVSQHVFFVIAVVIVLVLLEDLLPACRVESYLFQLVSYVFVYWSRLGLIQMLSFVLTVI